MKSAGRIAYITINNPTKMNAIDLDMAQKILDYLHEADQDKKVKCIVLKTAGEKVFTAVWDLKMFKNYTPEIKDRLLSVGTSVSRTIFFLKKPVIAQIQGPAIGAGSIFAFSCDFRIVAEKEGMYFHLPEMEINIPGATGPTVQSMALLGLPMSKLMMVGAEKISLDQMKTLGVITKTCTPENLDSEVKKFCKSLSEKSGTLLFTQKTMCNIIGVGLARKYYEMENEVANYFFSKPGEENRADMDEFIKSLWEKYGQGSPL